MNEMCDLIYTRVIKLLEIVGKLLPCYVHLNCRAVCVPFLIGQYILPVRYTYIYIFLRYTQYVEQITIFCLADTDRYCDDIHIQDCLRKLEYCDKVLYFL